MMCSFLIFYCTVHAMLVISDFLLMRFLTSINFESVSLWAMRLLKFHKNIVRLFFLI